MFVKGDISGRSSSFEDLLQVISQSEFRNRLLKTIQTSQYYTDGKMLTRLAPKELELVSKFHYDALFTNSDYKLAEPLNLLQAIPRYLREEIKQAEFINGIDKLKLVRLDNGRVKSYVEENTFLQFYHRICQLMPGRNLVNDTSWWMSREDGPIVVLDTGSFFSGRLLGTVAQFPIEQKLKFVFGKPKWKRKLNTSGCQYKKLGVRNDSE